MRPFGPQGPCSGDSVGLPGLGGGEKNKNMCIFPKENLEPSLSQQANADS